MDEQRKDHIDPERPLKGNRPKKLKTYSLPTDDVENIYSTNKGRDLRSTTSCALFPAEQKGCRKGSKGTGELFYIDQHIHNESKTGRKNLAIAWIDYKKAYDIVPQSCKINCHKMY